MANRTLALSTGSMLSMETCSRCGQTKGRDDFSWRTRIGPTHRKDGRYSWCKACDAAYYRDNRGRHNEATRRLKIRKRYNLSVEEYEALIALGCAICGATKAERIMRLDHCHRSGKNRAPLCHNCNIALGMADDRPETLRAMADYLESHE